MAGALPAAGVPSPSGGVEQRQRDDVGSAFPGALVYLIDPFVRFVCRILVRLCRYSFLSVPVGFVCRSLVCVLMILVLFFCFFFMFAMFRFCTALFSCSRHDIGYWMRGNLIFSR